MAVTLPLHLLGIRKQSDSPLAAAARGVTDFSLAHCNAGPLVASASIRDPDNLDSHYGVADEVTVTFTVDTLMPPVFTKWEIDKYLTFCTDCNPGCERESRRRKVEGQTNFEMGGKFDPIDAEYNGLGTAYTGRRRRTARAALRRHLPFYTFRRRLFSAQSPR